MEGRTLSHCRVLEKIGAGGLGIHEGLEVHGASLISRVGGEKP